MKKIIKLEGRDYLEIENLERPDNTLNIWFYEFADNKPDPIEVNLIIVPNNKIIDLIIQLHEFYDLLNPKKTSSIFKASKDEKNQFCFIGKTENEAIKYAENFLDKNNLTTYKRSLETYFIANIWINPKEGVKK